MITQIITETILLCKRCACNWEINSQTIHVFRLACPQEYHNEGARITQRNVPARETCVTDVLCNCKFNPK